MPRARFCQRSALSTWLTTYNSSAPPKKPGVARRQTCRMVVKSKRVNSSASSAMLTPQRSHVPMRPFLTAWTLTLAWIMQLGRRAPGASAERAEEGADVVDQRSRLFHRREVAAGREARPPLDVVHLLDPGARRTDDLLREQRAASRHLDAEAGRRELSRAHGLAVEAHR